VCALKWVEKGEKRPNIGCITVLTECFWGTKKLDYVPWQTKHKKILQKKRQCQYRPESPDDNTKTGGRKRRQKKRGGTVWDRLRKTESVLGTVFAKGEKPVFKVKDNIKGKGIRGKNNNILGMGKKKVY